MIDNVRWADPAAEAWERVQTEPLSTVETRRAAVLYAATRCAEDPSWLTPTREVLIRDICGVRVSQSRFWPLFDRLLAATLAGFGPMMMAAIDALVGAEAGEPA